MRDIDPRTQTSWRCRSLLCARLWSRSSSVDSRPDATARAAKRALKLEGKLASTEGGSLAVTFVKQP